MHQPQERILTGTMLATQPLRQETSTHHHSTCKVSPNRSWLQTFHLFIVLGWKVQCDQDTGKDCLWLNVSHTYIDNNTLWCSVSMVMKVVPHNILLEVVMDVGALAVCQWTSCGALVLNGASWLNEVIIVMWHVSYVGFIVFSSPVAGYPSPFLLPPPLLDVPLTEGLHPPSDPWGSAGSMVQPGYSAMPGNTPHLSQHGPFTAINPQDRLVSSAFTLWTCFSTRSLTLFD